MKNFLRAISLGVIISLGTLCTPVLAGPSQKVVVDEEMARVLLEKAFELANDEGTSDKWSAVSGGALAGAFGVYFSCSSN